MASLGWSGATRRCARWRPARRIGQMEACAGGQCQGALGDVDRGRPASVSRTSHIPLRWGAEWAPSSVWNSAQTVAPGRKTQTRRAPHDRARGFDHARRAGRAPRGGARVSGSAPRLGLAPVIDGCRGRLWQELAVRLRFRAGGGCCRVQRGPRGGVPSAPEAEHKKLGVHSDPGIRNDIGKGQAPLPVVFWFPWAPGAAGSCGHCLVLPDPKTGKSRSSPSLTSGRTSLSTLCPVDPPKRSFRIAT